MILSNYSRAPSYTGQGEYVPLLVLWLRNFTLIKMAFSSSHNSSSSPIDLPYCFAIPLALSPHRRPPLPQPQHLPPFLFFFKFSFFCCPLPHFTFTILCSLFCFRMFIRPFIFSMYVGIHSSMVVHAFDF